VKIFDYSCVTSTQDIARALLLEESAPFAVIAAEQTGGVGRRGNVWQSPKGNLYTTLVLPFDNPASDTPFLSYAVAVALSEVLESLGCAAVQLKWPNDVLLNGQKVAGVLLERLDNIVLVGVGLNVAVAPDNATCLKQHSIDIVSLTDLTHRIVDSITQLLREWNEKGADTILEKWLAKAAYLNQEVTIQQENRMLEGVFIGIDTHTGGLLLQDSSGKTHCLQVGAMVHTLRTNNKELYAASH
jgi:BirA family biotin operon repressor/biotin-[acetyl-CoA-carboxylase] ligase